MNPLYVGIDVSSKTNVIYLTKSDGSKIDNFSVAKSLDGSKNRQTYPIVTTFRSISDGITTSLPEPMYSLISTVPNFDIKVYLIKSSAVN